MDLRLYARVLWRFRVVVLIGVIVAFALAFLSYARVKIVHGKPVITYRRAVTYGSNETLVITQQGFPQGRAVFPSTVTAQGLVSNYADPNRFASLAEFYSYLANSDAVRGIAARLANGSPVAFTATPVLAAFANNAPEPLLQLQGLGTNPAVAVRNARIGSAAFRKYLTQEQSDAGIAPSQRALVEVLNQAAGAAVLVPRKKTITFVVFMAVIAATIALALLLENFRPRIRAVDARSLDREAGETRRSTA